MRFQSNIKQAIDHGRFRQVPVFTDDWKSVHKRIIFLVNKKRKRLSIPKLFFFIYLCNPFLNSLLVGTICIVFSLLCENYLSLIYFIYFWFISHLISMLIYL